LAEVNRKWRAYRFAYNNLLHFIDSYGMLEDWWDLNGGSLLNVKNSSGLPNDLTEESGTKIGDDDFFWKGLSI
jgi:hypothetical protein